MAATAQNLDFRGDQLDISSGQFGIFGIPLPDCAGDRYGRLLVEALKELPHLPVLYHDLGHTIEVPQDSKGKILPNLPEVLQKAG